MWVWINGPDVSDGAYQDFQNHLHAAETGGGGAALEPPPPPLKRAVPREATLAGGGEPPWSGVKATVPLWWIRVVQQHVDSAVERAPLRRGGRGAQLPV